MRCMRSAQLHQTQQNKDDARALYSPNTRTNTITTHIYALSYNTITHTVNQITQYVVVNKASNDDDDGPKEARQAQSEPNTYMHQSSSQSAFYCKENVYRFSMREHTNQTSKPHQHARKNSLGLSHTTHSKSTNNSL